MLRAGSPCTAAFSDVFVAQINTIYKKPGLRALPFHSWPGVLCLPFAFGDGAVDWTDDDLQGRVDGLLHEKCGTHLRVTRVARIYDENFIFLLKPDRMRYWLPSMALRDADETLADLRAQGF
jgi:hypothetical protein